MGAGSPCRLACSSAQPGLRAVGVQLVQAVAFLSEGVSRGLGREAVRPALESCVLLSC